MYHGGYFVANADAWFSVDPMMAVVLAVQYVAVVGHAVVCASVG